MTWSLAIAATASLLGVATPLLALETTTPDLGSRSTALSAESVHAERTTTPGLLSQAPVLLSQASNGSLLQLEDSGEAVTQLQTRLSSLGYYDGPISGVFGELTQSAVINFQQRNGLSPDGIAGAETFAAIDRAAAPDTAPRNDSSDTAIPVAAGGFVLLGDTGSDVTTLQQRLTALGYYQGAVDGQFGSQTEAALIAFQQAQGLKPDGIAGTATFSALNTLTTPPAIATAPTAPPTTTLPPAQPDVAFPSPTGLDGQATLPQTTQAPAPAAPIQPLPDVGVLELQRKLTSQGLYSGPLDGILNAETQQAIAEAQRVHGINPGDTNNQF